MSRRLTVTVRVKKAVTYNQKKKEGGVGGVGGVGGETVTGLVNGNSVTFFILFTLNSAARSHVT